MRSYAILFTMLAVFAVAASACGLSEAPADGGFTDASADTGAQCVERTVWPAIPDTIDTTFKKGPYLVYTTTDSIIVKWETDEESASVVEYGETAALGKTAGGENARIHQVTLDNLTPATAYYYRAGDGKTMSGILTASSAPGPNTPFRFVAYGDSQGHPEILSQMIPGMRAFGPSLWIHTGDMTNNGENYDGWQPEFFDPNRSLMHRIPFFSVIGNHEHGSDWWYEFFAYPFPPDDPGHMRYYSYTWGDAFFVHIDGDMYIGSDVDPQQIFVKKALSSAVAKRAKYRIVGVHQPAWSEYWGGCEFDGQPSIRDNLVPILEAKGVQLVLNGHTHIYQRATVNGVKHVITGGGGGGLEDQFCTHFDFVEKIAIVHHYTAVEVGCDEMRVKAVDIDGNEIDSFSIPARKIIE